MTTAELCNQLAMWCEDEGLPDMSADELIHEDITPEQRAWLVGFLERWREAVDAEDKRA